MPFLYIACGRDSLIKVGRTTNFKHRIGSLRGAFRRFGNELVSSHCFDEINEHASFWAERRLIDKLSEVFEQYAGREWFTGDPVIAYQVALITSQEAFFHKPPPVIRTYTEEQYRRWAEERAEQRERSRIEREEYLANRKKGAEEKRALRDLRRREIAQREAIRHGLITPAGA